MRGRGTTEALREHGRPVLLPVTDAVRHQEQAAGRAHLAVSLLHPAQLEGRLQDTRLQQARLRSVRIGSDSFRDGGEPVDDLRRSTGPRFPQASGHTTPWPQVRHPETLPAQPVESTACGHERDFIDIETDRTAFTIINYDNNGD